MLAKHILIIMALEATLAFLEETNRPFSVNEILSGIKNKDVGKAALQTALNTLVKKGKVVEKLNGKQKVEKFEIL